MDIPFDLATTASQRRGAAAAASSGRGRGEPRGVEVGGKKCNNEMKHKHAALIALWLSMEGRGRQTGQCRTRGADPGITQSESMP